MGCLGNQEAPGAGFGGHRSLGIAGIAGKAGREDGEGVIAEIGEIALGENREIGWTWMEGMGTWKGRDGDMERDIPMSVGTGGFPAGEIPKPGWDPGRACKSLEFPNFWRCWRWAQPRFQRIPERPRFRMREGISGDTLGQGDRPGSAPSIPSLDLLGQAGVMLQGTLSPRPPPEMSPPVPAPHLAENGLGSIPNGWDGLVGKAFPKGMAPPDPELLAPTGDTRGHWVTLGDTGSQWPCGATPGRAGQDLEFWVPSCWDLIFPSFFLGSGL